MPYCARMFTIPGASPQSGTTVMFFCLACASSPFLLENDLGVAPKVAGIWTPASTATSRHVKIETVGNRAHDGIALTHRAQHRVVVADAAAESG